jgi:hypothetical protein
MAIDDLQSQKNIEIFKERRNRQWIVTIPFMLLVIAAVWFRDHPDQAPMGVAANTFFTIFLVALASVTVFTFRNWRCPSCKGYLGKAVNPKFCPKCGSQLA